MDAEIVCLGVVASLAVGVVVWFIGDLEIERQWHERELKKRREAK